MRLVRLWRIGPKDYFEIASTGGIMIASPCKKCPKENLPKTVCAKDCQLLIAIQNIQIADEEKGVSSRHDYVEGTVYSTSLLDNRALDESTSIKYF
jgi:hypothetical protein